MKTKITTILACLTFLAIPLISIGQSPQSIKYQAVVRDNNGNLIANTTVHVKISILGGPSGPVQYCEDQHIATNEYGLFSLNIGSGTVQSGNFALIPWSNGNQHIKIEFDPNNGNSYLNMGTSKCMSVPYALYAESTGQNYTAGDGIQISGDTISTNISFQTSNFGDTLFLVPGNYVIIPGLSSLNSQQPNVTTSVITTITSTSANCGYTVTMLNGPAISARGVCWGAQHFPDISGNHTTDGGGTGTYIGNITGLTPNTIYYVRAYATNTNGTYYGSELMFTTTPTLPTVTTADTSNVALTTASCGGNVTDNGGANVTARGVCYGTSQNPTISGSKTVDGAGNGAFTSAITGLNSGTQYYVRAYATNSAGTAYGTQKSFTTNFQFPTIITDTVENITSISAGVYSYVVSVGTGPVTERGVCWNTNPNPTIYHWKTASGSGLGGYAITLSKLKPNTTYYVRAYATTANGTTYGNTKTFTTGNAYYESFESGFPSIWSGMGWGVTSLTTVFEGNNCLQANLVGDSIQFTKTVTASPNGNISFYYKANCYWCNGDGTITSFYIDDVFKEDFNETSWTLHSYSIPTGSHTFKWKVKQQNLGAFIDYIILSQ